MPGHARQEIVRQGEIGTYHTWSRCVQRACLCGIDPVSDQNFDHRREWIQSLLEYQASVFAVDVGNYTVLSNHQHLIARTRPDIAAAWSDEEVAWRWKLAWPRWVDKRWVREPTDQEIEQLLAAPENIELLRNNLADLSWFMARWKEPIAKMANRESNTKGHFYEQRFGSRELVDESALLCCSVYVDVNQVKAGMASSLETSMHSGFYDRLQSWRQREIQASLDKFHAESPPEYKLTHADMDRLLACCFLSPIDDHGPLLLLDAAGTSVPSAGLEIPPSRHQTDRLADEEESDDHAAAGQPELHDSSVTPVVRDASNSASCSPATTTKTGPLRGSAARRKPTRRIHRRLQRQRRPRASDQPILAIPPQQYEEIVRLTANRLAMPSPIPTPEHMPQLLRGRGVDPSRWFDLIEHFADWFHWAVGRADHVAQVGQRAGFRWVQGIRNCRDVFT